MAKSIAKLNKPLVNRIIGHGEEQVDQLLANPLNFRLHPDNQQQALAGAIDDIGFIRSVTVNQRTGRVVDGHLRVTLAARSGVDKLPVEYVDLDEAEEAQALLSLDPIAAMAATDKQKLDELFAGIESENENVRKMMDEIATKERLEYGENGNIEQARRTLAERFIVPPFSVLDARQGYWQDRKKAWIDLGIRSEVGRKENAIGYGDQVSLGKQDTSIFDPVLCEIAYRWFAPAGGNILDPFAGGSVRGVVASKLGHHYTGIDLSKKQIEANNKQSDELLNDNKPEWIVGNSLNVKSLAPGEYDFIFSCPPYYDLEVYSDEEGELSALGTYEEFIAIYRQIIADCVSMLKPNRFACFVVGDVRDKKGFYRNFPAHTIEAFQDAGMTLYNEAILVTMVGTASLRTSHQFPIGRKLGKTHQNVLVFYKGDVADIKTWGDVECGVPDKNEHIEQL